ncbi:MAG: HEPN domain-containing protein [Phycisphaerales bacterium]
MSEPLAAIQAWRSCADSALEAATKLVESHPRSSVSRSYYAAFAAAHAFLLSKGETPRAELDTWTHESIGSHVGTVLSRSHPHYLVASMRSSIDECKRLRVIADYGPLLTLESRDAKQARRLAGQVLELVDRIAE